MSQGLLRTMAGECVRHLDLGDYVTAEQALAVREVMVRMRRCDTSTALITDGGRLSGIFTERDVLLKVVHRPEAWDTPVSQFMTAAPVSVDPAAAVAEALHLMNEGHFRDLPVVDADGHILGNLTDNAIVDHLCDHLQAEVINLPPVPDQVPKTVEGA